MSRQLLLIALNILFLSSIILAQGEPIVLSNPSFEDFPHPGHAPRGWFDCGNLNFPQETPPDVHPAEDPEQSFGVTKKAADGDTFLGLVVRENDSWESVAQRLKTPLQAGECYTFSIALSTSNKYESAIRGQDKKVNFTAPLKLRIWGGTGYCQKKELLAESKLVTNVDWKEFDFKFEPKQKASYIILEAFFKTPVLSPPNGNILLDNASAIQPIPCDEELPLVKKPEVNITNPASLKKTVKTSTFDLIAKIQNVTQERKILLKVNGRNTRKFTYNPSTNRLEATLKLKEGINKITIKASNSAGNANDETSILYEPPVVQNPVVTTKPKKSEMEIKLDKLNEGQTIKVDKLFFDIDSYKVTEISKPALDEIYDYMRKDGRVKIEVGGHTNRRCQTDYCNELSTNRAKAVVDYLVSKGINADRLKYKGYGKTKLVDFGKNQEAQKRNQRVEIKIISKRG